MSTESWLSAEAELKGSLERIRTLEDALRVLLEESQHDSLCCFECETSRPCKYETARRALEGEG